MSAAISASNSSTQAASSAAFANLSSGDFLKIIIKELSQQDPLDPQDSSKLLEQFSSLRNVESSLQLQQKLGDLVLQNQISAAGGLIGKVVVGLGDDNDVMQGLVTSVRVQNDKAYLELDTGETLPMSRVTEIGNLTM